MLDVLFAWEYLVAAADIDNLNQVPTYQYDLVDVTRQALQAIGDEVYPKLIDAFEQKNILEFG